MRFMLFDIAITIGLVAACSSKAAVHPDATPIDAPASICGKPGDVGNDLGIGKYCASLGDCSGNQMATLCSSLGDPTTHFCTRTCTMGTTTQCGMAATCSCDAQNRCGCVPNSCL